MMVTSYPNRTSPVLRGKWVLDVLLGAPPRPPPANVPSLPEREVSGRPSSVRERLEQHRKNPACSSCHSQMDPLGFAFEHFDPTGAWRSTDGGVPIDATGQMPGSPPFEDLQGLRSLLLSHRDQFIENVAARLLSYAVGRPLEYYDFPAIRQIRREAISNDTHWSALILGIVRSAPFRMRQSRASEKTSASIKVSQRPVQ
jgi:hypothetical protein